MTMVKSMVMIAVVLNDDYSDESLRGCSIVADLVKIFHSASLAAMLWLLGISPS